jgi:general secretion pathway protein B
MSLILEALKKSDQERRRDRGPDLQTIHQPPPRLAITPRRSPWLAAALLVAVNLAALAGWWQWQRQQPATVEPEPAVTSPADTAVIAATAAATPSPAAAAPQSTQPQASPPAIAEPSPIQEMWEVPDPVRHALPAMTFSFHVYSENPERRTIIINDRRMRQGDSVGDGVVLEEITEDGVILALDHHRIHIPVLSGW